MTYINPFDFKTILVGFFLGNQNLLIYAIIMLCSYGAGKLGMDSKVFLTLLFIVSLMFGAYIGQALYFLALLIGGIVIFRMASKIVT